MLLALVELFVAHVDNGPIFSLNILSVAFSPPELPQVKKLVISLSFL